MILLARLMEKKHNRIEGIKRWFQMEEHDILKAEIDLEQKNSG